MKFTIIWKKIVAGHIMLCIVFIINTYVINNINVYLSLVIQLLVGLFVYLIVLIILRDDIINGIFEFLKSKIKK